MNNLDTHTTHMEKTMENSYQNQQRYLLKAKKMKAVTIATLTAIVSLSYFTISLAHGADLPGNLPLNTNNTNNGLHKNPFTKPTTVIPNNPPRGLPMDSANMGLANPVLAMSGGAESPEALEARFKWTNMRIVGYINDNVLLRVEDINNSSNNSGSNNGSNNNNSNGSNNNEPIVTILTTVNSKFIFNKNEYTLKKLNNSFVVYNRNNIPMHSMMLESSPARLFQRATSNSGSSGVMSTSNTNGTVSAASSTSTSNSGGNSGSR